LILPVLGLVLLSTLFTLVALIRYQPVLDPSRAALLYVLEPAFAAMFARILVGEPFHGWKLVGCLTLLAANLSVEVRPRRASREARP
jgi:drug/metabolite transporter (DMT)-like permease